MIKKLHSGKSLFSRLLWGYLLIVVILTTVIGAFALFLVNSVVIAHTQDKLSAVANVKADNLNRWVDEQRRNVVFIAALPEIRTSSAILFSPDSTTAEKKQASQELENYLRSVVNTMSDAQEAMLLDVSGNIVISSLPAHEGIKQGQEEFFKKGLSLTNVTSFYNSKLLKAPTITISTPLFNDSGQRVGVLALHLNIAGVDQIIREGSGVGQNGEIYLVGSYGQLITDDPLALQQNAPLSSHGIESALSKKDGSDLYSNYRNIDVIGAYLWVDERDVALLVEVSRDEALADVGSLALVIMGVGLLVICIGGVLIYNFSLHITRPIEMLTDTATQIADGHLELTAPVRGNDEIGELARAFNAMTSRLRASIKEKEVLNQELESRVEERTLELQKTVDELESFSYSISHDLRAPLRAISGYARIIESEYGNTMDADAHQLLGKIYENAIFMGNLVDDLLAFSRLGRQAINLRVIPGHELERMAKTLADELRVLYRLDESAVKIGQLATCLADPGLLRQVYANLLSNALKFSQHQPEPRVEVGCVITKRGEAYFVRDNGVGFDMKYLDKIFGVFHRLHHQDEFEGTGVGLAIVHRIIHMHGGEIWAESAPGKGATFFFTLGTEDNIEKPAAQ